MYQLSHFSKKLDLGMALFMGQPYLASYGNSQVTFRLRNRHLPSQNEKISKRNREQHLKPTHKSLVISNEVSGSALGFTAFILLCCSLRWSCNLSPSSGRVCSVRASYTAGRRGCLITSTVPGRIFPLWNSFCPHREKKRTTGIY